MQKLNLGKLVLEYVRFCLQRVLKELQLNDELPMIFYGDNKTVISIANNPIQHDRTKHVEIYRHFIKEELFVYHSIQIHSQFQIS